MIYNELVKPRNKLSEKGKIYQKVSEKVAIYVLWQREFDRDEQQKVV